jgi:transcriptional regulator with XRE-family HTH domain
MVYPVLDPIATGERIRELRKQNNLKVREVSEYMGFESEQAVFKWQRGDSMPTLDNMLALSRLFKTSIDDIVCERNENYER